MGTLGSKIYLVGGADAYFLHATDNIIVLDTAQLHTPQPCLYQQETRTNWWFEYEVGHRRFYPYVRQFLEDEAVPAEPWAW